MASKRKNRHASEPGQRLEIAILNKYESVANFARKLAKTPGIAGYDTILATLSKMINGLPVEKWNKKFFLPTERLLGVRMADITDGVKDLPKAPRGLFEIGTQGTYEDFEWLARQTDGSIEVIRSYDEWSKSIFDYVYESQNISGLHYLVDHGFYEVFQPGKFSAYCYHPSSDAEHALILLNLLAKDDDPEFGIFIKLFDSRKGTDMIDLNPGIFQDEDVLDAMINNERAMQAICRKPDIIPESELNGPRRVLFEKEYQAICASNWLTPLLCYALKHEDKYREQAMKLLEVSLEIASDTLTQIGNNITILGGPDESISTKNGHVILGHRYVIGVIGEPSTEGEIRDPELREKANLITAKIGSFRALAKIQTPVYINGKMHLPWADHNPIYKTFVNTAKGHPYLLQKSEQRDGDTSNLVCEMPAGSEAHGGLTLNQWKQVGKALKSIHQIDCGTEGKSFCHGRFCYPDFFLLPNGNLELICGYNKVYIGDPEEDVLAMGFLAFKNNIFHPEPQDAIEAFLKGYGYPFEGFLEKLWDYLVSLARKESNMHEVRYLMDSAVGVLSAIHN